MLFPSSSIGRQLSRTLPSSLAALTSSFHPVLGITNKAGGEGISRRLGIGGHWIASTASSNNNNDDGRVNTRALSSSSTPLLFAAPSLPSSSSSSSSLSKQQQLNADNGPPESLTIETILASQEVMKFYILHGIGKYKLEQIANNTTDDNDDNNNDNNNNDYSSSLVERWQRMIAIYLETQCRTVSLMGYPPDEYGITQYTQQLQQAMTLTSPSQQERVRVATRDTYRLVLSSAFATLVPNLMNNDEQNEKNGGGGGGELSIVDARNIMHKVSLRMLETEILEKVSKRCAAVARAAISDSDSDSNTSLTEENNLQLDFARKHTIVQEVMVTDVYLSSSSDSSGDTTTRTSSFSSSRPSLVEECGFGTGEAGYVRLQYALAEHQGDPLITQYVGTAIMQLLQAAGIDMEAMQKQAQEMQQKAAAVVK